MNSLVFFDLPGGVPTSFCAYTLVFFGKAPKFINFNHSNR